MAIVLVTGGSGFIGVHCIVQLLNAGHRVRTTLRSLAREAEVRAMVREGGAEAGDALTFGASVPHTFRSADGARVLWILAPALPDPRKEAS